MDVARRGGVEVTLVVDDDPKCHSLSGVPVLSALDPEWIATKEFNYIIAIGVNAARASVFDRLGTQGGIARTLVHPSSVVAESASLGAGTVACAGAVVNPDSVFGKNCILNTSCSVDHDCVLGDHVHVCPGVRLAGGVMAGDGVMFGTGAIVIPGVKIGAWSIVGAGAVVLRDVPDRCVVFGNPARVVRSIKRALPPIFQM